LIKFFSRSCPELKCSEMALAYLISVAELITLTDATPSQKFPEPFKLGLYLVLENNCDLVF